MSLLDEVFSDSLMVSLEAEVADGQSKKEVEYEIYGKMRDIGALASAPRSELQEQWGIPIHKVAENAASGNLRVRCIDDTQYVFTSKVKEAAGSDEVELECTKDLFIHFKKFADQGLRKVRYFFPVEGTDFTYEVDAFYNNAGTLIPWVKIDLEIPEGMTINDLPDLPFEMDDIRVIPPGKKNPADLEFVQHLFQTYFRMPNQYIDPHAPGAVSTESAAPRQARGLTKLLHHFEELGFLSTENNSDDKDPVEVHKKRLIEFAEQADSLAGCLSFNTTDEEGRVKQCLEELHMAIAKLYRKTDA